jgi:hypothetical protein
MKLPIGTRVKPSPYALRSLRDRYLYEGGSAKARKRADYDREAARRGTVTNGLHPRP